MWYYIGENINGTFVIQKEITKEEFQTWKESVEQLKYYTLANRFKDITIKNGLELEKYLKRITSISDIESIRNANTSIIGTESNRLMLNYLVSFRTFVDNLQAYSKNIKKVPIFKKTFSITYMTLNPFTLFYINLEILLLTLVWYLTVYRLNIAR